MGQTLYGISMDGTVFNRMFKHSSTFNCGMGDSTNLSSMAIIGNSPASFGFTLAPYLWRRPRRQKSIS